MKRAIVEVAVTIAIGMWTGSKVNDKLNRIAQAGERCAAALEARK